MRRLAALALMLTCLLPTAAPAADDTQSLKQAVLNDPGAPVLGNPQGRVTLVEFSDYNCGFCRKAMPEVAAFLAEHPDVRLVIHETPIFGEGSRYAAMAALAADRQGKYPAFHRALMQMRGSAERASVLRAARAVGLDTVRLERDMQAPEITAWIEATLDLADRIGLVGTPSFVAGDQAIFGYLSREDLAALVAGGS